MTLQDNSIDFTTLTWVKPELDETLKQARNALQSYVEEGENPAELRTCADLLHQVQGTLRMVELYGAAMVAEEMEQLGRALMDKRVDDRDAAYSVLMQGIVQLPDYLERLQGGHRDIPIVLLPLLNQLRASRGEKGLSESVLFSPDLSRSMPASAQGPAAPLPHLELTRRAEALRGLFQGALLRWLKDDNSPATIRDLTDVCEQLVPITSAEPARRLFWVAAGTLDALARNAFPISTPLKQALAKVEREIKRLADGGDAAFRIDPPIELTKQLLYFVAHEGSDHGRIGEIRQVFGLSGSEPSEAELAHARGSLSGNNRALLETVAVAIKDDLLRVKDALDLHLRTPGATPAALSAQVDALDRVSDTLGMLGLAVPRRVVQDQRTAVNDVVSGVRRDDEATLLDIAGALLYVEAALDDQVERLGKEDGVAADPAAGNESRRLLEALVKEAIVNFSQARQSFVGFVETHWDHRQLAEVPRLLNEVAGALRILNVPLPADYLVGIRQFTENELLQRKQVPNGQQMDRLADALASLEYFLEALRDRRPNREQILEVARQSLTALGYWPLSAAMRAAPVRVEAPAAAVAAPPKPVEAPVQRADTATPAASDVAATDAETAAHVAEGTAPSLSTPPAMPAGEAFVSSAGEAGEPVPGFDASSSEEIDDEIREVFLEEFEEEIENLQQLLPPWRDDPGNAELLRPIRRVFHTLKGSGRLVGARALGEFSWKIESMLNRVLDGSRPASVEVVAMVQLAMQQLPQLRAALQGQQVHADLEGIQAVADQLAAGEEATYRSPVLAAEAPVEAFEDEFEDEAADAVVAEAAIEPAVEEPLAADAETDDAPVFSIDPVLLEILKPEVAGHLETVDAWLAACAARGPQPVTDPLLRSIHTMNGAFAMTEVMSITEVTAPLEGFVKRSLAHDLVPGDAGIALVADAARAIRATVQAIEKPRPVLPHFSELAARAVSLRDTLPDSSLPSVPVHVDDDQMPQVVVMEAADTSAIPDFAADEVYEAPVATPAPEEADFALEPADETIFEAELTSEALADQPWLAEEFAPAEEVVAVEAAEAIVTAEYPLPDFDAAAEPEAAPEMALEESQPEQAPAGDFEEASEAPAAVDDHVVEAFETAAPVADIELADFSAEFEPSDASAAEAAELEAAFASELPPMDFEPAVEAEAVAESGIEDAAAVEAVDLSADFEPVAEVEPLAEVELSPLGAEWDADLEVPAGAEDIGEEADEATVAHAEFPEDQLFSVAEFLQQSSQEILPAEATDAAADEYEAGGFDVDGPVAAAEVDSGQAFEFTTDARFDGESESAAAGHGAGHAAVEMEAIADEPGLELVEAEAEVAGFEPVAEGAAESDAVAYADADAVVEYESYTFTDASSDPARESDASDDALAGMIAAFDSPAAGEPMATEPVHATAGDDDSAPVFSDEDFLSADALASLPTGEFIDSDAQADVEPPVSFESFESFEAAEADEVGEAALADDDVADDATVPESPPAPVAIEDDYYGMSLAELEALTSPADEPAEPAAVSADADAVQADESGTDELPAFVEASLVGDVPAWTGLSAPEPAPHVDVESGAPAADEFVAEEVAADDTVVEEAVAEEVVDETVAAEEVAAEEMVAEEVVADEIVGEEIVAEKTAEETVAAEEVVAEEVVEATVPDVERFTDEPGEAFAESAPEPAPEPAAPAWIRPQVPMARDAADPDLDLDMTDLDPELLDLFLEESNDILDHSDGVLARLRDEPGDRESITNLQRDLHTLKGGARMAGIDAVGELGHAMESLLESVAEGRQKLDGTGVVVLERGFDRLHGMVARIGERKAIALPAGLIAQVEALSQGLALGEAESDAEAGASTDGASAATPTRAAEPARPLSAPIDDLLEEEMTGVRAPQEQVRIRADLLDRLVNYAGEVAIYRARLEQQLGAFRANLGELNQTTTRLREQLRRLDIETEAQIVARYQREGEEKDANFDPLELDRFTNQQQLTRALNESANDLVNLQGSLDDLTRQYETLLLQQSRVSSDLQEGLMRTRMVPFDALVPRLRRVLRQAATDTGKQVQLKVDGASGEMDRNVLERMTAPLEHMLRNAMAHGLELPAERRKLRKPEEGTVRIQVQREGSEVVLKVSDDGRGLDKAAIRAKAIERGLVKADAEMSDDALYGLILETGFSTAESVSRLAGRGVGMDVVYSEIRQLGGTLQIKSEFGKGSEFVIRLPFTLAVTQAVFVKIGDTSFAVPIASVQGVGRISRVDLDKQLAGDNPVFQYAGEDYVIHDLGQLIGHAPAKAQDSLQMPLLLARSGELRTAICIDQVLGSREIVVKPVGPQVNSVPGIFGATIMGDGRVVVILDVAPLVRRQGAIARAARESGVAHPAAPAPVAATRRVPVVMVVDDSITMRKVTGRVLERNNMEVLTAKDGVDAVEKMAERVPDLVLLDIEMPRMDGYEVAQNMKSDPRLRDVPIIMITSRTGDKHRQRAMDIGVDRYLGKPYQEPELMRNVFEMLRMEPVSG